MIDIVTVIHNEKNKRQAIDLEKAISQYENDYTFYTHSNEKNNLGFAKGCNAGAFRAGAKSSYIGFLNPDVQVTGPFIAQVEDRLRDPLVVITGNSFGKPRADLDIWGVKNWVCGATFFVRRDFFTSVGGFDPHYEWAFEETDLIRRAEQEGLICSPIDTPHLSHESPEDDDYCDSQYKMKHFNNGAKYFHRKWR